jgi:hypothetical protein
VLAWRGLSSSGHPKQTALRFLQPSGWVTVTHPFHPLSGKRFQILKMGRVVGREALSLFDEEHGTVVIPRDWTDQASPSPYTSGLESPPILDPVCLLQLRALCNAIQKRVDDAK